MATTAINEPANIYIDNLYRIVIISYYCYIATVTYINQVYSWYGAMKLYHHGLIKLILLINLTYSSIESSSKLMVMFYKINHN